jgi:hypothetical protein
MTPASRRMLMPAMRAGSAPDGAGRDAVGLRPDVEGRTVWAMDRIARVGWGLAFRCRVGVLLFGASIDGSLLYGDLPAPDGDPRYPT